MMTVRHYCQGIGDSHLLRFRKEDGSDFFMLIDCGLHSSVKGSTETMAKVVEDIAAATGRRLDVLVVTHEHWDHVSAFLTAAEAFEDFRIGEVWMGWTENPEEDEARELDKFKTLVSAVTQRAALGLAPKFFSTPAARTVSQGLAALSGFQFGLKGERVRKAREAAKALAPPAKGVTYLDPATRPFDLPGVSGVRVYVLGPPRARDLLRLTTRESEQYHFGLRQGTNKAMALASALDAAEAGFGQIDTLSPFDVEQGYRLDQAIASGAGIDENAARVSSFLREHYSGPEEIAVRDESPAYRDQSWRRIDDDWLYSAADLALQLDSRTNNTSLVLAFEFVGTGRVALFAADAQVGNWLSWQGLQWQVHEGSVTGPDLLQRTVYYKVSHHGSENATLETKGLELMTDPDLSAFIPTNAADAEDVGWHRMPFDKILTRLKEKTSGRVIRSDDPWVGQAAQPSGALVSGSITSLTHKRGLWVEVGIA